MPSPTAHSQRRAPRVHLGASLPAFVHRENGQRAKAKLHAVSVTGGLLQLSRPLCQGDFVEVAFQTQSGRVQGLAEMLSPSKQPQDGVLQPFRFLALADADHRMLRMTVDCASNRALLKPSQASGKDS